MYCMCFSSKSTSSTFSPARKVLSMTRPCRMCLSLVRTKAPPLPGLTCWKSTMVYGCPSCWILSPFLNSAVDSCMRSYFPFLGLGSERLYDAHELSERLFPVAFVEICPGQDEARRRVLRKADEALLTEPDGLTRPADLAIRVGQRGKGESSRVFGEAFFVATDCAGRHGIGG